MFPSSMHIEWSLQRMPIPSALRTSLCSIMPIDISVIEIPRRRVRLTWLWAIIAFAKCVTMPSWPPTTLQPMTLLSSLSNP